MTTNVIFQQSLVLTNKNELRHRCMVIFFSLAVKFAAALEWCMRGFSKSWLQAFRPRVNGVYGLQKRLFPKKGPMSEDFSKLQLLVLWTPRAKTSQMRYVWTRFFWKWGEQSPFPNIYLDTCKQGLCFKLIGLNILCTSKIEFADNLHIRLWASVWELSICFRLFLQ